jgi:hypothetical protein
VSKQRSSYVGFNSRKFAAASGICAGVAIGRRIDDEIEGEKDGEEDAFVACAKTSSARAKNPPRLKSTATTDAYTNRNAEE